MSTSVIDGNIAGLYAVSLTLDPANIATITCAEQDFTVPGVLASDIILTFNMTTATAGLGVAGYRVKAANTISVTFVNPTAGAINAAAGNFRLLIARLDSDYVGGLPS
jgi:hypothetical protein